MNDSLDDVDVVVDVQNATKCFYPGLSLRQQLYRFLKPRNLNKNLKSVAAVSDVNIQIRKGEVVGIIGANGAGKTTLVKLIAGLLPLDEGVINLQGKVTALLALGLGVHPDFSGRENILFGGLLLGMSASEINSKTGEIIDFSELEEFIDNPLRTYSSGMRARLIFSIAMSVEPDILIVDEALATGDAYFVEKCQRRIREICSSGATVVLISHNLQQIDSSCGRVIYMDQGKIIHDGTPRNAIDKYLDGLRLRLIDVARIEQQTASELAEMTYGSGEVVVREFFTEVDGVKNELIPILESCEIQIIIEVLHPIDSISVAVDLFADKSATSYAFLNEREFIKGNCAARSFSVKPGVYKLTYFLPNVTLGDGGYDCDVAIFPADESYVFSYETCHCYYRRGFRLRAEYKNPALYGRGTLSEISVDRIEVTRQD